MEPGGADGPVQERLVGLLPAVARVRGGGWRRRGGAVLAGVRVEARRGDGEEVARVEAVGGEGGLEEGEGAGWGGVVCGGDEGVLDS